MADSENNLVKYKRANDPDLLKGAQSVGPRKRRERFYFKGNLMRGEPILLQIEIGTTDLTVKKLFYIAVKEIRK